MPAERNLTVYREVEAMVIGSFRLVSIPGSSKYPKIIPFDRFLDEHVNFAQLENKGMLG